MRKEQRVSQKAVKFFFGLVSEIEKPKTEEELREYAYFFISLGTLLHSYGALQGKSPERLNNPSQMQVIICDSKENIERAILSMKEQFLQGCEYSVLSSGQTPLTN